jgi:arylsulfatase A-like enzyme
VRQLVSLIDIAPTLLDRLGAPVPAHWAGESLARPGVRRFVFLQDLQDYAVIGRFGTELYKYPRENRVEQLFNLSRDSREQTPLSSAEHAAVFAELRAQLDPVMAALPKSLR